MCDFWRDDCLISSCGSVLCFLCSCACDAVRWEKSSLFEGVLLCTDREMFQRNVLVELISHEVSYVILRVTWKGKTLGLSLIIPAPPQSDWEANTCKWHCLDGLFLRVNNTKALKKIEWYCSLTYSWFFECGNNPKCLWVKKRNFC